MTMRATTTAGPWLDMDDVVVRLQKSVNAAGGQTAWAIKHEMSVAYVNDVLRNRRLPGDKITTALGLEKALFMASPRPLKKDRKGRHRDYRPDRPPYRRGGTLDSRQLSER